MEEQVLFNYRGYDICLRKNKDKFELGMAGKNRLTIWITTATYSDISLAVTSGRDYMREVIDKLVLGQKKTGK